MRTHPPLMIFAAVLGLLLQPLTATAQSGDEGLFSASGGASPNILLLLDTSGSMGKEPSDIGTCTTDCRKRDLANKAIRDLVTVVNPPDGDGGYINNAHFGFSIFTKKGARLLVPVGEDNVSDIVDWVVEPDIPTAADNLNGLGGNSHGLAMMEMTRYLAHDPDYTPTNTFGFFPPWGFADAAYSADPYPASWTEVTGAADPAGFLFEDPTLPSVWDLACRPTYLVHIDDGLWGGNDGDRFGGCSDVNGDGSAETCALEHIEDSSGDGEFWMEDIAKKMFETDFAPQHDGLQNVVTHVIGFDDPAAAALMQVVAEVGGGEFHYATSGEALTDALFSITVNIFESIASFAGVAVPTSRSSSGSALYNTWFEPRGNESIWGGHLEAYGLSPDGAIMDASTPPVAAIDPDTGLLVEPHNPYWDAGEVMLSNTSRAIYTTNSSGNQVVLNTTNISHADLVLGTATPPPPPPPDPCDPIASSVPAGWDFQLISPATLPDVEPDGKVKLSFCVDASRAGKQKDFFGTFPVNGTGTDAIDLNERKADKKGNEGICPEYIEQDLKVGKEEQLIQVRYYLENDLSPAGLAGWGDSICVTLGGGPPPPLPDPAFASYPNAVASGIDTFPELHTAVIDFAYGKDGFDEDNDGDYTENRTHMLGDIFHSTPLVVGQPTILHIFEDGYQTFRDAYDERDRTVYAGANDGMLHAFHAGDFHADNPLTTGVNEGDDPDTPEVEVGYYDQGTGTELFGYVPGVLIDKLKILSHNIPRSVYFVDAPPVSAEAWLGDGTGTDITKSANEWATVLITGLREGGAGYLALDVTSPGATAFQPHGPYPKLLWEMTHAKLADTWSQPIITRVKLQGAGATGDHCGHDNGDGDCREQWVAIFGAGYDNRSDPNHFIFEGDSTSADWSDTSKAIFMVALDTGAVLASVEYDASGVNGPDEMLYALPSTPAVLDIDFDGFADVVYIGDLGGQLWKWDISDVGADSDADPLIDNWTAGIFFSAPVETLDSGVLRYRSMFFPPAAAFSKSKLTLAFGTGEREDLLYAGDTDEDDNNRLYVIADLFPTGASAFASTATESDLTDVTDSDVDGDHTDLGFYFSVADGEKFVTDVTIFAGIVFVASYSPESGTDECVAAGGQAFLYAVDTNTGQGVFDDTSTPPSEDRRTYVGGGLPSAPVVSMAPDSDDDRIYIKTSTGQIIEIDPDVRDDPPSSAIYWRQIY